jgi:hypothetical protein
MNPKKLEPATRLGKKAAPLFMAPADKDGIPIIGVQLHFSRMRAGRNAGRRMPGLLQRFCRGVHARLAGGGTLNPRMNVRRRSRAQTADALSAMQRACIRETRRSVSS